MTNTQRGGYRRFDLVMAGSVAVLMISNIASCKILSLGPLTFDGGTLLFPVAYILGDVVTEVYGYQRARRVIWVGFATTALMAATLTLVGMLPSAAGWEHQMAYEAILGVTPRIVLGSLVAYWAGSFSNAWVMAKLKIATQGRFLWLRTISSTLLGEGVDTVLFVLIAFWGVLPASLVWAVVASNYVFKCVLEVAVTPITYQVVNALKRAEGEDHFDYDTSFNPFRMRSL
ncbi:MAG: queuosine precursor transporter [Anaerolineae bacterium]|nr:queuosine precursor transporter [Anaerolineae bacterium]